MESLVSELTILSNEFGINTYVKGGGGNSSVKTDDILWIKPSGTTMATIRAEDFVTLKREGIRRLDSVDTSVPADQREKQVLEIMTAAKTSPEMGRPSVEAPVHNLFDATYVIHTHPTMVNGMTCAKNGPSMCAQLFPEALWLDYIDPGFTLYQAMAEKIAAYKAEHGREPSIVFMKNHGIFVASDTPDGIREIYRKVMATLEERYNSTLNMAYRQFPCQALDYNAQELALVSSCGEAKGYSTVMVHSVFPIPEGPISPDHIVYMKSLPYSGPVSREALDAFVAKNGYFPKVIKSETAIYVLGQSTNDALLAMEILQDASQILQLAPSFGGIEYMTERATQFIENWEVESYRRKQALQK